MNEATKRPTFGSAVIYKDPRAAIQWLEKAFAFETTLVVEDSDGSLAHSEMSFGDGYIMVGYEWMESTKSPLSVGGANTQIIHVQLEDGIDAHCERARAAGAVIEQEPEDQFYGDRTYRARDPEGHVWTFGQTLKVLTNQEMEAAAPGLKVRESL